jgi:hypothetical protein
MSFRCTVETRATEEQAFHAFTEFSEHRLEIWKGILHPRKYELLEYTDSTALVKEGSGPLNISVVLRYEWDEAHAIRWTLVESNHCGRGAGLITIKPGQGGGSLVEVEIDHGEPRGLRGRMILGTHERLGPVAFPRMWKRALDRYAANGGSALSPW